MARKKLVTKAEARQSLTIEGNEVIVNVIPAEVQEVATAEEQEGGKPQVKFTTPQGEAVYEYVGNCVDCGYKRPPVERAVFACKSHPIRADEQIGLQLAVFRRDGKSGSALCQDCYAVWKGAQPKREARFQVL